MREPIMRMLPALGVDDLVRALPQGHRDMLYAAPRGNLCVTIDPAARWHDGARTLVKYLNYRIERPMLDVPGFTRQLSPQEA